MFGRGQCQSCTAFLIIIPWYRAKRKDIDIIIYFSIVAKGGCGCVCVPDRKGLWFALQRLLNEPNMSSAKS